MSLEFKSSIVQTFDWYKRKNKLAPLICLPVYNKDQELTAYLRPITVDFEKTDPQLVDTLGRWRLENPTISTGTFSITPERTRAWLENHILGREDRLLFLIESLDKELIGHIGYSNFDFEEESAEIDSVLRGVKDGYPGFMSASLRTLLLWGKTELALNKIKLSVYSDNEEPIQFYEKNGFVKTHQKPLYRVEMPGESKLEIAPEGYTGPIEKYYLYMEYDFNSLT